MDLIGVARGVPLLYLRMSTAAGCVATALPERSVLGVVRQEHQPHGGGASVGEQAPSPATLSSWAVPVLDGEPT